MNTPDQTSSTLAPYAVTRERSRGRAHADPYADATQCPFEQDRQRILSCTAFRRLMHKTQVFVTDCGDHYRTRLTHTLEVVSQAQRLASLLRLNARLAGGIAMAHDLGHAPFGHAGEAALAERMKDHGGFEHNRQSLRVVDYLEHPYPEFRGLNLSFELRESLIKHRTWYDKPDAGVVRDESERSLLESGPCPPLEGQVVNLADAIAYSLHDIEDGLLDGALTEELLSESELWREAAGEVIRRRPTAPLQAIRRPILDFLGRRLVMDVVEESGRRIAKAGVKSPDDVRACREEMIGFSEGLSGQVQRLGALLRNHVYRNPRVSRMDESAKVTIVQLFDAYLAKPEHLPERFAARLEEQGRHRVIADYIAGMTDRYCRSEHEQHCEPGRN